MPTTYQIYSKEALHKEFHKPLEGEVWNTWSDWKSPIDNISLILLVFPYLIVFKITEVIKNNINFKSPNHARSCTVGRLTQTPTTFSFLDGSMIGTLVQHYLGQVQRIKQVYSVRLNVSSWWNEACYSSKEWILSLYIALVKVCASQVVGGSVNIVNECLMRCLRAECSIKCLKIKKTQDYWILCFNQNFWMSRFFFSKGLVHNINIIMYTNNNIYYSLPRFEIPSPLFYKKEGKLSLKFKMVTQ